MNVNQASPKTVGSLIVSAVLGVVLLVAGFGSFTIVEPGNVGVVFNQVTGSLHTASQGMVGKLPFVTSVQSYPVSLRTYTMVRRGDEGSAKGDDSIDLPTKQGQHISQDISVTYNTSEDKAAEVYKRFKGDDIGDIENTFVRRTIITVAQNLSGQMDLSELISTGRDKLQSEIETNLRVELSKAGFTLDKVNLGASHLPAAIEEQMQNKMKAQQEAQQAEYTLQKEQTMAKAAVAKAQGEANSTVVLAQGQAEANKKLQTSLTPLYIEYLKMNKWDGQLPQVTGGNPIISLGGQFGKTNNGQ